MNLILTNTLKMPDDLLKEFNRITKDFLCDYNQLIEQIGEYNSNDRDWLLSELCSRNILLNDKLFLQLAYLNFVDYLIGSGIKINSISTDFYFLYKSLRKTCKKQNIKLHLSYRFVSHIYSFLGNIYYSINYLFNFVYRVFAAKMIKRTKNQFPENQPIVLIDIFIFNNSFKNGKYIDRYFDSFGNVLSDEEKNSFYYIITLLDKNYPKIFKEIRNSSDRFLLLEDYLTITDWFSALFHSARTVKLLPKKLQFKGFDLAWIFRINAWSNIHKFYNFVPQLNFRFIMRLKKAGIKVKMLLDWNENQVIDKSINLSFSTFFPDARQIGYRNSFDNKFYLNYFPTDYELENNLLPKELYVSGKGCIEPSKFFSKKVDFKVAPDFRHAYIWKERTIFPESGKFSLFLSLPITSQDIQSILQMTAELVKFKLPENFKIIFKCHPSQSLEYIQSLYGGKLPKIFELANGDFQSNLERSDLAVSNNSSTPLEIIARGVPVIILANKFGFTNNPIPENVDNRIWRVCYTVDEYYDSIIYYSSLNEMEKNELYELGKEIRNQFFEPITREATREFLKL